MSWYRTGTVTVTNGSAAVTGAGTDFVSNVSAGDAFEGPDGRTYEVAAVVSATQLTLARNFMGSTAGGQAYDIQPTQSYVRDLALAAATLLGTFAAVRDGIGAGLIADGTAAAPGVRFSLDQDTGFFRAGGNLLGVATGGVQRAYFADGGLRVSSAGAVRLEASQGGAGSFGRLDFFNVAGFSSTARAFIEGRRTAAADLGIIDFATAPTTDAAPVVRMTIDENGYVLIGTTAAFAGFAGHTFAKSGVAEGAVLGSFFNGGMGPALAVYAAGSGTFNAAASALKVSANTSTGRSINAAGTFNASGADYAEYMRKTAGCGTIAAGDVCGVTAAGELTKSWADAVRWVVKSTAPAYVGGDSWAAGLAPRPERDQDEADPAFAARLAAWEAQLEAERIKVDRIAFAGQVPVNVSAEVLATCAAALADCEAVYLVAVANGGGIAAAAALASDMDLARYMKRLGAVWAIRDGRPIVDVQHG